MSTDTMSELLSELRDLNSNLSQQKAGTGAVDGLRSGMGAVRATAESVTGLANDVASTAKAVSEAKFHIGMIFDPTASTAVNAHRLATAQQVNLQKALFEGQQIVNAAQHKMNIAHLVQQQGLTDAQLYAQIQGGGMVQNWGGTQVVAAAPEKNLLDNKLVQGTLIVGGLAVATYVGVKVGQALVGATNADTAGFDGADNVIDINAAGNY